MLFAFNLSMKSTRFILFCCASSHVELLDTNDRYKFDV